MRLLKNNNIKKLIFIVIVITIAVALLFILITVAQNKRYNNILNNKIDKIVNTVINNYPEITEEEILEILNGKEGQVDVLRKYGYDNDEAYIKTMKATMRNNTIINITFISSSVIAIVLIFCIYLSKQENKIEEVKSYLKEINDKNYDLKIDDNGEDEISKLRNELYKTTVLLKETAENSETEKEQLKTALADISHQLKTPLTSITIMLDNIIDNPEMEEKTKREFVKEISRQIDWINSLVISLLKLARFDAGVINMNNKKINAGELIENAISNLSVLLEIKNVNVIEKIEKNVFFTADYKWQLEALTNILKNAIEHSRENSNIYIDVENTSLFLKIIITDEGSGIEKEDLKHIFERFYKSKNSSGNSIGIGLPLSKAIIEKNNGYIKVTSEVEKGTKFEIKYIK